MRGFIVFILLILLVFPGFSLTIDQAINLAKESNPALAKAKRQAAAAGAATVQKSWLASPILMLEYQQIPPGSSNLADAEMRMYGLAQNIPWPNKLWLKRSAALQAENAVKYEVQDYSWQLRAQVVEAYFQLYFAQKKLELNQANLGIVKGLEKVSESKYLVGRAAQVDLLSAQVEAAVLENNDLTLEEEFGLAEIRGKKLLNTQEAFVTESDPTFLIVLPGLTSLKASALANNPKLLAIKAEVSVRQNLHDLAKAELLPDFKTTWLQRENAAGPAGWDLKFALEIPLWFWTDAAKIRQAGYEVEGSANFLLDYQNALKEKVASEFVGLSNALRSAKVYREVIVPKATQALGSARTAYLTDKLDFFTLLGTQRQLLNVQLKYYDNLVMAQIHKARLEALIGGELK
ncbi:hypothetical protein COT42_03645 [Candidatus Saganbacteria bacterium CG08_land_8_20_14_0_20_45_16]|uniref:TolC family protein n=1 Tax=Candidatus Saganbacteria bacterium CG08_land_8_20_14_0_20_45_16 TaxID=2014293 RepID=A0A2H0Y0Y6_UNCSA|nr:MAG: hypothetical protein COT42_03645 [Candidatus Saganbacteria bacterium CG08_land_8_20_14_0_20_45_16]